MFIFNQILNIIIIYFIYDYLEKMFTKNLKKTLTACILDSSGVSFVKYFKFFNQSWIYLTYLKYSNIFYD